MEPNTEKIQINLSVEDLDEWNQSWKQPSLLAIKLQRQLIINRILSGGACGKASGMEHPGLPALCLLFAIGAMMVATWYEIKGC